ADDRALDREGRILERAVEGAGRCFLGRRGPDARPLSSVMAAMALTDPVATRTARRIGITPMTFFMCTTYFRLRFIRPRNGRAKTAAGTKSAVVPRPQVNTSAVPRPRRQAGVARRP